MTAQSYSLNELASMPVGGLRRIARGMKLQSGHNIKRMTRGAIIDAIVGAGHVRAEGAITPTPLVASPSPSVSTSACFIPPPWFDRLQFALSSTPAVRGACLFGPRGAGKTTAVHELARALGVPLVTFQAAAGATIDDLLGQRDLVDGRTVFTPGPLVEALEQDGWLLCEEANVMHPGTWSKLNTLLDGSGDSLALPDGRRLKPGVRFRAILAFNEGQQYAGTREVNAALRDRLMPIYADYLPAEHEAAIICKQTGASEAVGQRVQELAQSIRAAKSSLGFDLSPRALVRMTMLVGVLGESWEQAFEHAILDLIGDPEDKAPQREACRQIALAKGLADWPAGVSTMNTQGGVQ